MRKVLFYILTLALIAACQNKPSNEKAAAPNETTTNAPAKLIEQSDILLLCQDVKDPNMDVDAPQHEVFLQLAESKVKLADILNCENITPDLYEQYEIPNNASSAVGGWWAGAGDYLYLIEEGGNYVVKQGEIFEGHDGHSFNYKTIVRYSKEGEEVFE